MDNAIILFAEELDKSFDAAVAQIWKEAKLPLFNVKTADRYECPGFLQNMASGFIREIKEYIRGFEVKLGWE